MGFEFEFYSESLSERSQCFQGIPLLMKLLFFKLVYYGQFMLLA